MNNFFKSVEGKFISVVAVVVVCMFGYYFYQMSADESANAPVNIEVNATDHIRGSLNGKVTLVEFGDFQCPACGNYEPLVEKVIDQNKKDLKFVFRHFPLTQVHQNAMLAAKASESASLQGKFWEMHDVIYAHQTDWSEGVDARNVFISYAQNIGLDVEKFKTNLDNPSIEQNILAEEKEGVKLGVNSTPSFFLNGKKLKNPATVEEFDALIKKEIQNTK